MGGSKKKSPAKQEKSQGDAGKKSGKKGKKEEGSGSAKAEISVMLTDEQAMKAIKNAKVITVQELARQTGVKISAANAYLRKSVEKGTVKKIGGHSGHRIYQPVSA
ncbi:MAG TPA: winged helix-turn-helix transcriptional regulator [Nitrosopumilaceae archaeon]|nr:winged helix-turn-helix transcriptional regulator [Nitrosopumilaceae archaeon]